MNEHARSLLPFLPIDESWQEEGETKRELDNDARWAITGCCRGAR